MCVENPHNQIIVSSLHQETQKILSSVSELGSSKNQDKICLLWKGINEKITNINKITFCLSQGTSPFLKKKICPIQIALEIVHTTLIVKTL